MERKLLWCVLVVIFLSSLHTADAFIERKMALQEVLSQSTNIVYGTVKTVDAKRQRFVMTVEQDIKGTSNIEQIKVNVAVGQRRGNLTSPEKFMKSIKVGEPAIMFYKHHGNAVDALGHTGGTWYQCRSTTGKKTPDMWWTFTHIEVRMHRTFKGTTVAFQDTILKTLRPFEYAKPGDVKVLAFAKSRAFNEFSALSTFDKIAERNVLYKSTQDAKLPDLDEASILWIGYRSMSQLHTGKYVFDGGTDERIKAFVKNGGVVIVSGQDSDPKRSCGASLLAKPIKGVEGQVGNGIRLVKDDDLFAKPQQVAAEQIRVDDAWAEADAGYSVLALTKDENIALAQLEHGKGVYIVTAMQNGRLEHLKSNSKLMGNLMNFAVRSVQGQS
ncbi:hypothetical protein ACFL6S_05550 [Candidatus Poribacteria bacterium]